MKTKTITQSLISSYFPRTILIDFLAITFIYFLPALSHLISLPLYLMEPMRLAVIFCLVHTNRKNAVIIAVTVPLFSLVVSSHPAIIKSVLITIELLINLFLFYFLIEKTNKFISMFLSIILSKIVYYSAKFLLIQINLIDGELITTSLIIQWIVTLGLSLYVALILKNREDLKT
jgi:hypothetical protein